MKFFCPVCGFDGLDEPPYSQSGVGLYEICPCCGFQFGVTDDNQGISFHEWREAWIERGTPWTSLWRTAPNGWDPLAQLRGLAKRTSNVMNGPLLCSE
ncbi:MAG TPA: hypothetical protein VLB68_14505 [Pyrinomonadaceae bacterium]|nr:hypothetical protein [Pyrinomonadaceae bacterium]